MSTYTAANAAADIMARILSRQQRDPEVRPVGEIETVPECKILYRDGAPLEAEEVVTERTRVAETFRGVVIAPPASPRPLPNGRIQGRVRQSKPGRPARDPNAPVKRRGGGRGKSWSLKSEVVINRILDLQRKGLSLVEIAKELGCGYQTLTDRIREARESGDPEYLAADRELRTCPKCKRAKFPQSKQCAKCCYAEKYKHPRRQYAETGLDSLRPYQRRIAEAAALGLKPVEIAMKLGQSPAAVRESLKRMYKQLGVHGIVELVRWWVDNVERRGPEGATER